MNLKTEDNNMNMYTSNNGIENTNLEGNKTENSYIENDFAPYDESQIDTIMQQYDERMNNLKTEEPKMKGWKDRFWSVLGIIFFVVIGGWCLGSGINALFIAPVHPMEDAFTNLVEGDVYEGNITCISTEVGELKHTINFIPAGTEHFYLMVSEDGNTIIPIRASKEWDDQYTGLAWQEVSIQERGIVREMDYKVKGELMSELATVFAEEGIQFEQTYYLDLNANKLGALQIFAGVALILCVIYFTVVSKRLDEDGKPFKTAVAGGLLVLGFVSLAIVIYLLNMVGF